MPGIRLKIRKIAGIVDNQAVYISILRRQTEALGVEIEARIPQKPQNVEVHNLKSRFVTMADIIRDQIQSVVRVVEEAEEDAKHVTEPEGLVRRSAHAHRPKRKAQEMDEDSE